MTSKGQEDSKQKEGTNFELPEDSDELETKKLFSNEEEKICSKAILSSDEHWVERSASKQDLNSSKNSLNQQNQAQPINPNQLYGVPQTETDIKGEGCLKELAPGDSLGPTLEFFGTEQSLEQTQEGDPLFIGDSLDLKNTRSTALVCNELERLVVNLNHSAMEQLRKKQSNTAISMLIRAEQNLLSVDKQVADLQFGAESCGDNNFEGLKDIQVLKNRLLGLTYNNLGCVCKQLTLLITHLFWSRTKDFLGSLEYLKLALKYESKLEETSAGDIVGSTQEENEDREIITCNSAGTILNICAILSKINKHKQASEYAQQAVLKVTKSMQTVQRLLLASKEEQARVAAGEKQQPLIDMEDSLYDTGENEKDVKSEVVSSGQHQSNQQQTSAAKVCAVVPNELDDQAQNEQIKVKKEALLNELAQEQSLLQQQWQTLATTAVIAHYNCAVELEYLSLWQESSLQFEKANKLAKVVMPHSSQLSQRIRQALAKIRIKVRNKVQLPPKTGQRGQSVSTQSRPQQQLQTSQINSTARKTTNLSNWNGPSIQDSQQVKATSSVNKRGLIQSPTFSKDTETTGLVHQNRVINHSVDSDQQPCLLTNQMRPTYDQTTPLYPNKTDYAHQMAATTTPAAINGKSIESVREDYGSIETNQPNTQAIFNNPTIIGSSQARKDEFDGFYSKQRMNTSPTNNSMEHEPVSLRKLVNKLELEEQMEMRRNLPKGAGYIHPAVQRRIGLDLCSRRPSKQVKTSDVASNSLEHSVRTSTMSPNSNALARHSQGQNRRHIPRNQQKQSYGVRINEQNSNLDYSRGENNMTSFLPTLKDKPLAQLAGQAPQGINLKAFMTTYSGVGDVEQTFNRFGQRTAKTPNAARNTRNLRLTVTSQAKKERNSRQFTTIDTWGVNQIKQSNKDSIRLASENSIRNQGSVDTHAEQLTAKNNRVTRHRINQGFSINSQQPQENLSNLDGESLPQNLRMSPKSMQLYLSIEQEKQGTNPEKLANMMVQNNQNEPNFFVSRIRNRQINISGSKNKRQRSRVEDKIRLNSLKTPRASSSTQQSLFGTTLQTQRVGQLYLPVNGQKAQRKVQIQHKIAQWKQEFSNLEKSRLQQEQLALNEQMESKFQQEMQSWREAREQEFTLKMQEYKEIVQKENENILAQEKLNIQQLRSEDHHQFKVESSEFKFVQHPIKDSSTKIDQYQGENPPVEIKNPTHLLVQNTRKRVSKIDTADFSKNQESQRLNKSMEGGESCQQTTSQGFVLDNQNQSVPDSKRSIGNESSIVIQHGEQQVSEPVTKRDENSPRKTSQITDADNQTSQIRKSSFVNTEDMDKVQAPDLSATNESILQCDNNTLPYPDSSEDHKVQLKKISQIQEDNQVEQIKNQSNQQSLIESDPTLTQETYKIGTLTINQEQWKDKNSLQISLNDQGSSIICEETLLKDEKQTIFVSKTDTGNDTKQVQQVSDCNDVALIEDDPQKLIRKSTDVNINVSRNHFANGQESHSTIYDQQDTIPRAELNKYVLQELQATADEGSQVQDFGGIREQLSMESSNYSAQTLLVNIKHNAVKENKFRKQVVVNGQIQIPTEEVNDYSQVSSKRSNYVNNRQSQTGGVQTQNSLVTVAIDSQSRQTNDYLGQSSAGGTNTFQRKKLGSNPVSNHEQFSEVSLPNTVLNAAQEEQKNQFLGEDKVRKSQETQQTQVKDNVAQITTAKGNLSMKTQSVERTANPKHKSKLNVTLPGRIRNESEVATQRSRPSKNASLKKQNDIKQLPLSKALQDQKRIQSVGRKPKVLTRAPVQKKQSLPTEVHSMKISTRNSLVKNQKITQMTSPLETEAAQTMTNKIPVETNQSQVKVEDCQQSVSQTKNLNDQPTNSLDDRKVAIVSNDRVIKIADKINLLNVQLQQFQSNLEQQMADPLLNNPTTRRSEISKHLECNQSGNTLQSVPSPTRIQKMQDKRAASQLQSAPGQNRAKLVAMRPRISALEVTTQSQVRVNLNHLKSEEDRISNMTTETQKVRAQN